MSNIIELMKQSFDLKVQIFQETWPFLLVLVVICAAGLFWKAFNE